MLIPVILKKQVGRAPGLHLQILRRARFGGSRLFLRCSARVRIQGGRKSLFALEAGFQ
jgi:hypothetical protein